MAGGGTPAKEAPDKKKGGLMGLLVPVLVLTLVAGGGGAMLGTQILAAAHPQAAEAKPAPAATAQETDTMLKELSPVVTNLSGPDSAAWVRLQAAIVFSKADAPGIDLVAARINDDIMSVLRTLRIADLQGASGLEILREDLAERANIRSDGHVREFVIETLVIQ